MFISNITINNTVICEVPIIKTVRSIDWEEQRKKFEERHQKAIRDILADDGINSVIRFAESVESPFPVAHALEVIAESQIDDVIILVLLNVVNKKLAQFASGYVRSRHYEQVWSWVDGLDKLTWTVSKIGQFLRDMPFTEETWKFWR